MNNTTVNMSRLTPEEELSFDSDDLDGEAKLYDEAPYDIYGEDIDIGRVLVANANDSLPKETKYKTTVQVT